MGVDLKFTTPIWWALRIFFFFTPLGMTHIPAAALISKIRKKYVHMLEHICLQLFVILDPYFFLSLSNYIRNKPLSKAVVHDEERVKQRSGKRFINSLTSITAVARSDSPETVSGAEKSYQGRVPAQRHGTP